MWCSVVLEGQKGVKILIFCLFFLFLTTYSLRFKYRVKGKKMVVTLLINPKQEQYHFFQHIDDVKTKMRLAIAQRKLGFKFDSTEFKALNKNEGGLDGFQRSI